MLNFLRKKPREIKAVVMPDFFLDRFVNLNCEPSQLFSTIETMAERKGGSIDGIIQTDFRGGNAINTASALANLGINTSPIICTNKLGLELLRLQLKQRNIDFSHVKLKPRASIKTALEFQTENHRTNIMLRDVGSLANFGPEELTPYDCRLIEEADYVCLFNWAGTKKYGTKLAETVFRKVKSKGRGKTYYDTADPKPNIAGVPGLIQQILKTPNVDILSLNENEAIIYAGCFEKKDSEKPRKASLSQLALESARILVRHLPSRIDLHTTDFSATLNSKSEVIFPVFDVKPIRATGAGDAWNAGNIFADANALSDKCRLALANAVSACYISDPEGKHPTPQRLAKFIESVDFPFLRA